MSLAQQEPNGYAESQLQELGAAALKPGLGFQAEGVQPVPPCPFSIPRNTGPKKATDHPRLRESRPPAGPALRPALGTGRSPRKAAPLHGSAAHRGPCGGPRPAPTQRVSLNDPHIQSTSLFGSHTKIGLQASHLEEIKIILWSPSATISFYFSICSKPREGR